MPLVRPSVPDVERITGDVRTILRSGTLTKGPYLEELERRVAAAVQGMEAQLQATRDAISQEISKLALGTTTVTGQAAVPVQPVPALSFDDDDLRWSSSLGGAP
jgi:hypothetical protein